MDQGLVVQVVCVSVGGVGIRQHPELMFEGFEARPDVRGDRSDGGVGG